MTPLSFEGVYARHASLMCRGHPLFVHAAADVQQHAETDRDPLVAEIQDLLRLAIVGDDEVLFLQTADEASITTGHGGGDVDEIDAALEDGLVCMDVDDEQEGGCGSSDEAPRRIPHDGTPISSDAPDVT